MNTIEDGRRRFRARFSTIEILAIGASGNLQDIRI